ncbi:tellurite resistance TerB family protein [Arenicella xantha]|uniref:Uncharacterized membrane protein YebE (DUF533 family) n=1 Tax=Arenicella xantha TaxID=644221 RepID=A0A395JLE3_9GAMM|nr:DUF533 domain-containing protein [Arenicella xantha]RBP51531.1 uncharacterized membrane protein YebE (DUF533 family) [Arenicella xantha]
MSNQNSNLKHILDQLLSAGKQAVSKGQSVAEDKLDIPQSGEQRELMLNGMKKGALASALLVGLLGTRGGRSLTGTALKLGGLAALGAAAYKGYQNWQSTGEVFTPIHELDAEPASQRGLLIIQAMVAAANADGRIDDAEQLAIKHQILELHLSSDDAAALESIVDAPLSAQQLASRVSNVAEANEVYLATRLLISDTATGVEKQFRDELVANLKLSPDLISALEAEVV